MIPMFASTYRRSGWPRCSLLSLLLLALVLGITFNIRWLPVRADDPGYALEFNGTTNYVRVARINTVMDGTQWATNKTMSLWVKPSGTSPAVQPEMGQVIVATDFPRLFGINRATVSGADRLWVWNWDSNGIDRIGIDFVPGEWVHIALVHNGSTLAAYKNGVLVGSVASGATNGGGTHNGTLYIGGSGRAGTTTYFPGQVDEVRLWTTALDQAAIADWMARNLTAAHPNWAWLAADYRMSTGTGTTLVDDSGHGQGGTLLGGMHDANWVISTAFEASEPTPTPPPNDPPIAHPQSVATAEDTAINITLSGSDPEGAPLSYAIVAQPSKGVLSGSGEQVVYTPNADVNGEDSFTFVVNNGNADSASAAVAITIHPVQDAPIAVDDSIETDLDTSVTISVLANDSDVDDDPLTVIAITGAANGSVVNDGGDITYTPISGYTGADSFGYTISDGQGGTASATVSITVAGVPPQGHDAGYALAVDGTSDFVRLAATRTIYGSGWETNHTVSLWVKPTAPAIAVSSGPGWCDSIFGDRPRWWGISHCILNGYDRIWVWNYDGNYDLIGISYQQNQWVHVTLMHSGGHLTAFRNGVALGSMPTGATIQPSTGALPVLQLGAVINNASRNWSFQGEIDEVRLWNIPLTEAQIQQSLVAPIASNEPGLVAYYQMSDGAGLTLTDDSIYTWNGTLEDGLPPSVLADGPIRWVPSGAFAPPVEMAQIASQDGDDGLAPVMFSIEGPPVSESELMEGPIKLFLPSIPAN